MALSGGSEHWKPGTGGLILYAAPGRYPSGQRGQAVNLLRKLRWFESNPAHSQSDARLRPPRRRAFAFTASAASPPRRATGRTCGRPRARCPRPRSRSAAWSRDRRVVPAGDPGDHRVEPVRRGEADQLVEQQAPDAAALVAVEQVDGVLDRGGVGRPGPERRQRPEPDDRAAVDLGDAPPGWPPECSSSHWTCSSRVRGTMSKSAVDSVDVVVVDGPDPRRVAPLGEADLGPRPSIARRGLARLPASSGHGSADPGVAILVRSRPLSSVGRALPW